jgi:hypothetical protein
MRKISRKDNRKNDPLKYRVLNGPFLPEPKLFTNKFGIQELCSSTGMEIYDSLGDCWWNEYVDSYGDFHYGR